MPFNIVTIFAVVVLWLYKKCKSVLKKAAKGQESVVDNETDGPCLKREADEEDERVQEESKKFDEVS